MTFDRLFLRSERRLSESGFNNPRRLVRLLAEKVFGAVVLARNNEPHFDEVSSYTSLERRVLAGEPVDYVIGSRPFHCLSLKVDKRALIPRSETEELVEIVLRECSDEKLLFADVGTGSGAIALAIAKSKPRSYVIATDISESALELARENAQLNTISNVEFRLGPVMTPLKDIMDDLDVIVTNPPYVASSLIPLLGRSVREYEPVQALDGGSDGLSFFRSLAEQIPLQKTVYMEIASYSRPELEELVGENCQGYTVEFMSDSGNQTRFAVLRPAC